MIKKVDLHCQTNNWAHHTSDIATDQLIVRRGQSFLLTLEMAQPFAAHDMLLLTVVTGSQPSEERGTRSVFGNPSAMYSSKVKAIWSYNIDKSSTLPEGKVTLAVTPPAEAPVGKYFLSARTKGQETPLGSLVVLFNPWCSDDWVFLPDEKERQEYVMNEQGIIYTGTGHYIQSMAWDYGQFEEDMVDICLKILDLNPKHLRDPADDVSARCNPIYVGRVISAMINSNDDQGVLTGRWDAPYTDGVKPTHWLDSATILQRWHKNGCHPVKYGQCWVFAAVMCTVMRCLGIPCRVVTNFESAHNTDKNLTIDKFFGDSGVTPKKSHDSIWNFHVWVEAWMKRPDIMKDGSYDGWQILDPTPQERSQGVFCCGPAPVSAILEGHTDQRYDIPFIFAEVNADIVNWLVSPDGSKRKMHSDTMNVGQKISTKAVGSNMRNDITDSYKYREGSMKERAVFKHAVNRVNSKDEGNEPEAGKGGDPLDVEMRIEEETKLPNGQDIMLKLKLHSKSRVTRTLSIHINVQAMTYTGIPASNLQTAPVEKMLLPGQDLSIPIRIPFSVYGKHMVDCDSLKVSAVAKDKRQPENIYLAEDDVVLQDPPISITVLGQAQLYREMTVEVVFENPIDETLRNCFLTIIGSGLLKQNIELRLAELQPRSKWQARIKVTPYKAGLKTLVADFDCDTFRDIKDSCTIDIKPFGSSSTKFM